MRIAGVGGASGCKWLAKVLVIRNEKEHCLLR